MQILNFMKGSWFPAMWLSHDAYLDALGLSNGYVANGSFLHSINSGFLDLDFLQIFIIIIFEMCLSLSLYIITYIVANILADYKWYH